jgi:Ran GTPase-activating protein (RanGAP) involved in mRNA processing and transport
MACAEHHFCLCLCERSPQGLKALASAASLDQLTHLDLSHNQLGPAAAHSLQQLLSATARLQSLVLRNTAVGGTGVGGLAMGLSDSSRPLHHLDLSCTQLDDAGELVGCDSVTGLT